MMKNTKFCNKAFYDSNYDTKNGIPHFSRPKPLLFTLYQCSLDMFNQCFCKSNKRSLPHRVCVAILVSVYKPQNSPTEIAFCFLLPWKLWLSICCRQLPCLLSCLTQCMVNPAMTFQLGMTTPKGNNDCMVMQGWERLLWLVFWLTQSAINWLYAHHRQTPLFCFIFFASHCKQYISINLVSKHKSKIHSVLKISNAIVQKQ